MVPRSLYLPDGRRVPVCVIRSPRELSTDVMVPPIRFYRYKAQGGFEYVADFFIGPRSTNNHSREKSKDTPVFATHPSDSGTLRLPEPKPQKNGQKSSGARGGTHTPDLLPLAMQWGAHVLDSPGSGGPQPYALATCLSAVCRLLGVDLVRDRNLD